MAELDPNTGGGGPTGDRGIERRVGALENRIERMEGRLSGIELLLAEIKGQLSQMPKAGDFASLKADVAEVKGRVSGLPTTWQLLIALIGTWASGAAIVFTLLRFGTR